MFYQITDDVPELYKIFRNEEYEIDIYSNILKDIDYMEIIEILNIINPINEPKIQNNNEIIKEGKEETEEETEKKKIEISKNIDVKMSENSEKEIEKKNDGNENDASIENEDNEVNEKKVIFLIENEKMLKIGNKLKNKSYRCDNLVIMIIRNLIQEIFLDWINYGVSDNSKQLCKINPQIFRKKYDFKGKKLKEIYSKEISKKEKEKHFLVICIIL